MVVGFTCSTFDLFHAGHVAMLREAKANCDHLLVGIQTDPTIDRPLKNKPVQSIIERQIQVSACRYVDEIILYTMVASFDAQADLLVLLNTLPINMRFVGEEYFDKDFTGKNLSHIKLYYNRRKHQFSSSSLRDRVVSLSN